MRASGLPWQSPEKALESLYRRHVREIYRYTLALLDSAADAEDATQATFLNAYRALERGERPRDAAKWLRAIAVNVCREHFRRSSRRPHEVSLDEDPGELVAETSTPTIGDVLKALSHIPFNQRAALLMREFEGRSLAEIAVVLGVSSSAVEAMLFRARRALREQLEASLRCDEAERAIYRQLDGQLPRGERGPLRAHLRECAQCASLARRLRAQRSALKSLALVPLPASLAWSRLAPSGIAGIGSAPAGASLVSTAVVPVAAKVVAATLLASIAVGAGYVTLRHAGSGTSARSSDAGGGPMTHQRPTLLASAAASPGIVRNTQTFNRGGGSAVAAGHGRPGHQGGASPKSRGAGASNNKGGRAAHSPNRFASSGRSSNAAPGQSKQSGHPHASGHRRQGRVATSPHRAPARRGGHRQAALGPRGAASTGAARKGSTTHAARASSKAPQH